MQWMWRRSDVGSNAVDVAVIIDPVGADNFRLVFEWGEKKSSFVLKRRVLVGRLSASRRALNVFCLFRVPKYREAERWGVNASCVVQQQYEIVQYGSIYARRNTS
jgi:hypothetical protein